MADQSAAFAGNTPVLSARLEPDAIGMAEDMVIGMASSAPAVTVGLTLAPLAAATAYGSAPTLILCAIPMLVIANAYRRCNIWNANCGASFEWVGRAINPYLGFLTGWMMIAAYIIAAVSGVAVLGPSVLAVAGTSSTSPWGNIGITSVVTLGMLVIAVIGIRITAQTQVGMAVVEYAILVGFAIVGLVAELAHHPGTVPITKGMLSVTGIGGKGSATAGFLIAVFIYSGWDGTLYVNEEVQSRRTNPGRAAVLGVALLAAIYTLSALGLQGVVSPARMQAHSASALVYVAQALGGSGWSKVMALGLALSVIATTGTAIVLSARIVYGMASYRTLPAFLANVSRRFRTPAPASVLVGVLILGLTWVYLLTTSVQAAFNDVIAVAGLLFTMLYILTALACVIYYRRLILSRAWHFVVLGLLPLAAAGFLGWVLVKSVQAAPASQIWSLAGVMGAGLLLMLVARFGLRSGFFQIARESEREGVER